MARIFRFPDSEQIRQRIAAARTPAVEEPGAHRGFWKTLCNNPLFLLVYGVVVMLVMVTWPFLRWIVTIDLTFQLLRAMVLWDTPGVHAGLECFLHFAAVGLLGVLVLGVPTQLDDFKPGAPRQ